MARWSACCSTLTCGPARNAWTWRPCGQTCRHRPPDPTAPASACPSGTVWPGGVGSAGKSALPAGQAAKSAPWTQRRHGRHTHDAWSRPVVDLVDRRRANVGLVSAVAKPAWAAEKGPPADPTEEIAVVEVAPRTFLSYYLAKVEVIAWSQCQPMLAGYAADRTSPPWRRSATGSRIAWRPSMIRPWNSWPRHAGTIARTQCARRDVKGLAQPRNAQPAKTDPASRSES